MKASSARKALTSLLVVAIFFLILSGQRAMRLDSVAASALTSTVNGFDLDGDGIADQDDPCPAIPDLFCYSQMTGFAAKFLSVSPEKLPEGSGAAVATNGELGMLVADFATDQVLVYVGNGDGTFEREKPIPVGDGPVAIAAADFNGDGRTDVMTANLFSNNITLALGKDGGAFGKTQTFVVIGNLPRALAIGDFNSDGYLDVAVANAGSSDVAILLGRGDGRFLQLGNVPLLGLSPSAIITADLNGDSILDLAITNLLSNDVSILIGDGKGGFVESRRLGVGNLPIAIAARDFDQDGRLDLAVANFGSDSVSVLSARLRGKFFSYTRTDHFVGQSPLSLVLGEFVVGTLGIATANFFSSDVSLVLSDQTGAFGQERRLQATFLPLLLVTGDFNNDGALDLVVVGSSFGNLVTLIAVESGRFRLKRSL